MTQGNVSGNGSVIQPKLFVGTQVYNNNNQLPALINSVEGILGYTLTAEQKNVLRAWVTRGGHWRIYGYVVWSGVEKQFGDLNALSTALDKYRYETNLEPSEGKSGSVRLTGADHTYGIRKRF